MNLTRIGFSFPFSSSPPPISCFGFPSLIFQISSFGSPFINSNFSLSDKLWIYFLANVFKLTVPFGLPLGFPDFPGWNSHGLSLDFDWLAVFSSYSIVHDHIIPPVPKKCNHPTPLTHSSFFAILNKDKNTCTKYRHKRFGESIGSASPSLLSPDLFCLSKKKPLKKQIYG